MEHTFNQTNRLTLFSLQFLNGLYDFHVWHLTSCCYCYIQVLFLLLLLIFFIIVIINIVIVVIFNYLFLCWFNLSLLFLLFSYPQANQCYGLFIASGYISIPSSSISRSESSCFDYTYYCLAPFIYLILITTHLVVLLLQTSDIPDYDTLYYFLAK